MWGVYGRVGIRVLWSPYEEYFCQQDTTKEMTLVSGLVLATLAVSHLLIPEKV